jgi:hypothetical protein
VAVAVGTTIAGRQLAWPIHAFPFWFIAFFADGKLKKTDTSGGGAQRMSGGLD